MKTISAATWAELEKNNGWAVWQAPFDNNYNDCWDADAHLWGRDIDLGIEDMMIENIVAALDIESTATVMDLCCGPGRLTTALAAKCQHILAVDGGDNILKVCEQRLKDRNISNYTMHKANYFDLEQRKNIPQADIVFACHSPAAADILELSKLATKRCIVAGVVKGPISLIVYNDLFYQCGATYNQTPPPTNYQEELAYMERSIEYQFGLLIALGALPKVSYAQGGLKYTAVSREQLYQVFSQLSPIKEGAWPLFCSHVDQYTYQDEQGFTFYRPQVYSILQWNPADINRDLLYV